MPNAADRLLEILTAESAGEFYSPDEKSAFERVTDHMMDDCEALEDFASELSDSRLTEVVRDLVEELRDIRYSMVKVVDDARDMFDDDDDVPLPPHGGTP